MGNSSSYRSPKTVLVINKPSNAKLKVSTRLALNFEYDMENCGKVSNGKSKSY